VTPVSASATETAKPHHRMTLQQRFDAADTNHDGKLTKAEAEAGFPALAKHFSAIDSTGKGYVTMADIKAYERAWRKAHPRMTLQQRFDRADTNHDGHLTEAEASAAGMKALAKHFSEVDTTGKGYVTLADIQAYLHARHASHKPTVTN
jgi:Ca2+-binding EF-hand superfamily protein